MMMSYRPCRQPGDRRAASSSGLSAASSSGLSAASSSGLSAASSSGLSAGWKLTVSLATLGLLFCTACGRKHEVDEISLADSGIEIAETVRIGDTDWNAWRGPSTDGNADGRELPTQWDESTNIRWRTNVPGRGHGSPIVVGSAVVLATADDRAEAQSVLCFDRENGSARWTTVIHEGGFPSKRELHPKGSNANGTIACDGSRLITAMLNSDAIIATALDLEGNILWQQEVGKFVSRFGYAPSPVLYKSLVIFAADNEGGGYVAALDRETGRVAWRTARPTEPSYSSAAVANVGGKDQLLISGCDSVTSYDPTTGERNWQTPCLTTSTCGTVVTTPQRILAAGGFPDTGVVCLSPDGEMVWSNNAKFYEPSMIVVDDYVVGVNDDGIATCWTIEDGQQQWKKRLGGDFSASPIVSDGLVYASNLEGDTFVFRPGEDYELVSKNQLGDDCYASPAASAGELFLRIGVGEGDSRQEQLVCIADLETASE